MLLSMLLRLVVVLDFIVTIMIVDHLVIHRIKQEARFWLRGPKHRRKQGGMAITQRIQRPLSIIHRQVKVTRRLRLHLQAKVMLHLPVRLNHQAAFRFRCRRQVHRLHRRQPVRHRVRPNRPNHQASRHSRRLVLIRLVVNRRSRRRQAAAKAAYHRRHPLRRHHRVANRYHRNRQYLASRQRPVAAKAARHRVANRRLVQRPAVRNRAKAARHHHHSRRFHPSRVAASQVNRPVVNRRKVAGVHRQYHRRLAGHRLACRHNHRKAVVASQVNRLRVHRLNRP